MENEDIKKSGTTATNPVSSPAPSTNNGSFKDGEQGEDELIDNMPDSHPEPAPSEKS